MDTLNDRWLRIAGITLLMILTIVTGGFLQQALTGAALVRLLLSFTWIVLIWHINRWAIFRYRAKFPTKSERRKRLLLTSAVGIFSTLLFDWIFTAFRYWAIHGTLINFNPATNTLSVTVNDQTVSLSFYGLDLLQATLNFLLFLSLYELLFFIRDSSVNQQRLKQAEQEQEKLRAANLQSQLDALKQQVNPHFLFNSLNVLDSLIEDDPPKARVFLEELSTVYRYLLRSNEHHLTDLANELTFIHSYFHLLKTRHGMGIHLQVHIDERYQEYKLPPLTLQLLVENAVKHNIALPEQPLIIEIITNGKAHLEVRNNVQRKTVRVASNGVGLTNILTKYQMMCQPAPAIHEIDGQFVVTLPLITQN